MSRSTVFRLTAEFPYDKDCIFNKSINLTILEGTSSPTPHACETTRLYCNWLRSFEEIF